MRGRIAFVMLAGAALLVSGCASNLPRAAVSAFEAEARITADGSIAVHEQMTVAPGTAVFERRLAPDRADGVTFVSATIDGQTVDPGREGAAPVSVSDGRRLRVRWQMPAAGPAHVLGLDYRLDRAVEISGRQGRVHLRLLDASRAFDVARARLAIEPPAGLSLLAQSGIAEAGWTVARVDGGIAGERTDLAPEDSATLDVTLPIDPGKMADPVWQLNVDRAEQFAAAFISGGAFILVIGIGVLWIVRLQYPRGRTGIDAERRAVRRGLRLAGLACFGLAVVTAAVAWFGLSAYGVWPMAVPAGIFLVGLVLAAFAGVVV